MLTAIACLLGVFIILVIDEILVHAKILSAEYRRKFAHITVGTFVASWPWLVGWRAIQIIGVLMLIVVAFNQYNPIFRFNKSLNRRTYGDYFFGLAILASALLTSSKIFFMIAMLHMALADASAALIGNKFGKQWRYQILGHTKTVIGSMAFWVTSLIILGVGVLFAHNLITFNHYVVLLLILPPVLTALENISVYGLDNLIIPLVVIAALRIAQSA